jgi:hypothetical protein
MMPEQFWVADLDAKGEISLTETYEYDVLQSIGLAAIMIAEFATYLWSDPSGFDIPLPGLPHMSMRWRPSADTAGIATLWCHGNLASLSLLATGIDPQADTLTFRAFQLHLVRELHDTGYEPAFDLMTLPDRPLVASIHLQTPDAPDERAAFSLADRCFAAAYFRYQRLV